MPLVSVIIPSYKDPYLWSTIQSLLDGASGDLEIIPVLDGYWPEKVYPDPRVKYLHLGANRGMRRAINSGISLAKGQYLMRSDEHCAYAKGWDAAMIEACAENAIVTPRRYFLDPTTWTVMDLPPWDYERLEIRDGVKFEGRHWRQRERERPGAIGARHKAIGRAPGGGPGRGRAFTRPVTPGGSWGGR